MESVIVILVLGAICGGLKYLQTQKHPAFITGGRLLVKALAEEDYKKANLPNDYDEYPGELEASDTKEYIEFITQDILELIK